MKNIKKYEDFLNEEINLKKVLTTGALATGMAMSNPIYSQKVDKYLSDRVDTSYVKIINKIGTLNKDSLLGYYRDENGKWIESTPNDRLGPYLPVGGYYQDISTYKILFDNKEYILMLSGDEKYITPKYLYDNILNSKKGEVIEVKFNKISSSRRWDNPYDSHALSDIQRNLSWYLKHPPILEDSNSKLMIIFGENIVRFRIGDDKKYNFKYCYNECKIEDFNKIIDTKD